MTDQNKKNLMQGAVMLVAFITVYIDLGSGTRKVEEFTNADE